MTASIADSIRNNLQHNSETITAVYQIVTPMFIGDALQEAHGITVNSFKGALRFWWRALVWGRIRSSASNDAEALKILHEEEALLFGSSAINPQTEKIYGKGRLAIQLTKSALRPLSTEELEREYNAHDNGAAYALGQGLLKRIKRTGTEHAHSVYLRTALKPEESFTVTLSFNKFGANKEGTGEKIENQINELKQSLFLLGTLGGLGSKGRRGLGSIAIRSLSGRKIPDTAEDLLDTLANIPFCGVLAKKPATVLAKSTGNNPWKALKATNHTMQMFRGWGFRNRKGAHMIGNSEANHTSYPQKQTDHDLVYQFLSATKPITLPSSFAFGLPRGYGLANNNNRRELKFEPKGLEDDDKRSRRASPVLVHIHQFTQEDVLSLQTIFHCPLFPSTDTVVVSEKIDDKFKEAHRVSLKGYKSEILQEYQKYLARNDWEQLSS